MFDLQTSMLQYAGQRRFLNAGSKVLAAVSGGIDSMTMLHLLHYAGVNMIVAHCNFGLRSDESDMDEEFVKTEAARLSVQCRVKRFDTSGYAAQKGISVQMAARELRYQWFNELAACENLDAIAIAHNRDDSIETLFINLARGTGIHGLTGIRPTNGKIIRPLLFASRNEIKAYAKMRGIDFREDSSNTTDKYARNYIRHNVIPGLEQFFPAMRQAIERSIENFSAAELFYNEAVENYKKQIVTAKDDLIYIDLQGLDKSPSSPTLLHEILKPFGFSNSVVSEIIEKHDCHSGRQFFSDSFRLVHDRKSLVLQKLDRENNIAPLLEEYLIYENTLFLDAPFRLKIDKFDRYTEFAPDADPNTAFLDCDKLQFPLILRKWKHGDKFRPLGMKSMKKLSDFLINEKLSLIEKERCIVVVSGGQIAWIAGLRIDDRFKIANETKKVCKFQISSCAT